MGIFSHTAGFPSDTFSTTRCFQTYYAGSNNQNYANETNVTLEECVQQLAASTPLHTPGSQFEYSDSAFEVIALLTQRLTNMSFEQAFIRYIGIPLDMSKSSYKCPIAGSTAAHAHPAIGFCTTANDFSKFTQLMFRGGQ